MKHPLVLAVTSEGIPYDWMTWQDSVILKSKDLISFELGNEDTILGGVSRMTGLRTHMEIGTIIGVKGKFKHNNKTPALTNQNLFRRDLGICAYCGKHFSDANLSRDHIHPVSKGGKDNWNNTISACKRCNNKKDNKTPEEAGMQLIWLPYTPNRYENLLLGNRNILVDQAQYIANGFIPAHSRAFQYLENIGISLN